MAHPSAVPYDPVNNNPSSPNLNTPDISNFRASEYDSVQGLHSGTATPGQYRDDPNVPINHSQDHHDYSEKPRQGNRKTWLILIALVVLAIVVLAVVLPVYFVVIRPRNNSGSSNGGHSVPATGGHSTTTGAHSSAGGETPVDATTGGDGSRIKMEDGTEFTYSNPHGGYWVFDPADPLNNGARAQSWSPALNETFRYGVDRIRGVNLGGWLNLEPFISPAPYQQYPGVAVDEWTLSTAMAADTARGGLNQLEEHYKTFITEEDFARIAGAGLNWIRLPIGFWAIETWPGEPFLERVSWNYFLKAIQWARKYGLRIQLDLHATPGSQNGWNHSGQVGPVNMLNGVMGVANAQRTLSYIRILAEFISQPQYRDVVPMFGVVNEPRVATIGQDAIEAFNYQVYQIVREASGTGEGNGPYISFHDGFTGLGEWNNFMRGADRIAMDTHPYFAFGTPSNDPVEAFATRPCSAWAGTMTDSLTTFGLTTAGEWSLAINDCGLFVTAVGAGTRYEGTYAPAPGPSYGSCAEWNNWDTWDQARKDGFRSLMLTSMESLQQYFFWTWNIGNSSETGKVEAPFWSYKLGLEQGWIPNDPREAEGACERLGVPIATFAGPLQPWQTGGAGAGDISAADTAALGVWPPVSIGGQANAAALPTYTPTGTPITMPGPTFTVPGSTQTIDVGSGWNNPADTALPMVPVDGCTYPDAWNAVDAAVPATCGGAARKMKRVPVPKPTPPPRA